MTDIRRVRVRISGLVQGVYFRVTCAREAAGAGVAGWVRNLPDDRVEAVFEGDGKAVDRMLAWARQGPPGAVVRRVEVQGEPAEGLVGFEVLRTE